MSRSAAEGACTLALLFSDALSLLGTPSMCPVGEGQRGSGRSLYVVNAVKLYGVVMAAWQVMYVEITIWLKYCESTRHHNTGWVKLLIYGFYAKKEEAAKIWSSNKVGDLLFRQCVSCVCSIILRTVRYESMSWNLMRETASLALTTMLRAVFFLHSLRKAQGRVQAGCERAVNVLSMRK